MNTQQSKVLKYVIHSSVVTIQKWFVEIEVKTGKSLEQRLKIIGTFPVHENMKRRFWRKKRLEFSEVVN